jgi:hypothetical protein
MEKMARDGNGAPRKMRRIGGWGGELRRWWRDVRALVNEQETNELRQARRDL